MDITVGDNGIPPAGMAGLRKGLIDGGLEPTMDPFRDFFIGRNLA